MKTLKFLLIASAIAVIFNSCSKTGPEGPQGAQGPQGNANVVGDTWQVLSWSNNGNNYYASYTDQNITTDIYNYGTVEVFLNINGAWTALPFTQYNAGNPNYYWQYNYTGAGVVNVLWTYNGVGLGSDPNTFYGTNCEFKDVCIAPAFINLHPNTNWNNAAEVLQLPEVQAVLNKN